MDRWTFRLEDGDRTWHVLYRGQPVAMLNWLVDIEPAATLRARITEALNGDVPSPPQVIWNAHLGSPHRWDLHCEGRLAGEFAWTHPPAGAHEQTGIDRVVDALNDVPAAAMFPATQMPGRRTCSA